MEAQLTVPWAPNFFIPVRDLRDVRPEDRVNSFVPTIIFLDGKQYPIAINCKSLVDRFKFIDLDIDFGRIEAECRELNFDQFIIDTVKPLDPTCLSLFCSSMGIQLNESQVTYEYTRNMPEFLYRCELASRWRRLITRVVKKPQLPMIINYLFEQFPIWRLQCAQKERIFIHRTREIRYAFEMDSQENLWFHYTYQHRDIVSLALNLTTEVLCRTIEYDEATGCKIRSFQPLFENNDGIIHFEDFNRYTEERDEKRSFFMVKVGLNDYTLENNDRDYSLSEILNISIQLLQGLRILEAENIVHLGIIPTAIFFTHNQSFELTEARLNHFDCAYRGNQLPNKMPISRLVWPRFFPPEYVDTLNGIELPFAIPVYQLGICFRKLFGRHPPIEIQNMIIGMTHPNPTLRWTAERALTECWRVRSERE